MGLAVIPFAIILYILFLASIYFIVKDLPAARGVKLPLLAGCTVTFITAGFLEIHFIRKRLALLGSPSDPESKLYHLGYGLSQYTNTIYFNGFTFVMGLTAVVLVFIILLPRK